MAESLSPVIARVSYRELKSRQKEGFNFQKVSAVLAAYGFLTIRLTSDWQGADFIAQHMDGVTFLKVQLKTRLTIDQKYFGKDLFIAFPHQSAWYLFPHDSTVEALSRVSTYATTPTWRNKGTYNTNSPSKKMLEVLLPFRLGESETSGIAE